MTLDVFFSYDSEDSLVVNRIKDGIEARAGGDIDIYVYEEDLQPGTNIPAKAKDRIKSADLFLVLVTHNSQESAWVQQEVGYANGVGCSVVPVLLDAPEKPELKGLLEGMEYLTFDRDRPEDFFRDFMDYAAKTWAVGPDGRRHEPPDVSRNGRLSSVESNREDEHIIIEAPVEVYRRDGDRHEVVAETEGTVIRLGIKDASVSRKKGRLAPIVFEPQPDGHVVLQNNGSTNPITVKHGVGAEASTVRSGESETLADTCTVEIGFNTRLKLGFTHDTIDVEELANATPTVERDGPVVTGVQPAMYVREATDNLLKQAKHGSVASCLKFARKLHVFVDEHPVSVGEYDEVRDRLRQLADQLRTRAADPSENEWPDTAFIERVELLAGQLVRLYATDARRHAG